MQPGYCTNELQPAVAFQDGQTLSEQQASMVRQRSSTMVGWLLMHCACSAEKQSHSQPSVSAKLGIVHVDALFGISFCRRSAPLTPVSSIKPSSVRLLLLLGVGFKAFKISSKFWRMIGLASSTHPVHSAHLAAKFVPEVKLLSKHCRIKALSSRSWIPSGMLSPMPNVSMHTWWS